MSTSRERRIYRVSEVNRAIKDTLEGRFRDFWVEGEIGDLRRQPSGHVYFTLNDERAGAQIGCVMFRGDAQRARAELKRGERVRLRGYLTLYEARGRCQLVAKIALPAGAGDLAAQFERMRKKLEAAGLLAEERKRALPVAPQVIGVVTSKSGAALRDVIRVAHQRAAVRLIVADCRVQGEHAPRSIVRALTAIQHVSDLDAVILTRGGGSAEDLAAFNDEGVCHAVSACRVPVVCGIGHETDVSLAELVADRRAATPSNAAELLVHSEAQLRERLEELERRLHRGIENRRGRAELRLERLERRLPRPEVALRHAKGELDTLQNELHQGAQESIDAKRAELEALTRRLTAKDPKLALLRDRQRIASLEERIHQATSARLWQQRRAFEHLAEDLRLCAERLLPPRRQVLLPLMGRLDALSPLKVLERGYAISFDAEGNALRSSAQVHTGDEIKLRLHEGELKAKVTTITGG